MDTCLYIDPLALLSPKRFDLGAKLLYAKHYCAGRSIPWLTYAYGDHLRVWGCFEKQHDGKASLSEYVKVFESIIKATARGVFDYSQSPIVVQKGNLWNGAHRVAAAIACNKHIRVRQKQAEHGQLDCNYAYFSGKETVKVPGLDRRVALAMAQTLGEFDKKARLLFINPVVPLSASTERQLKEDADVYFATQISLSDGGAEIYTQALYGREQWAGKSEDGFPRLEKQRFLSCGPCDYPLDVFLLRPKAGRSLEATKASLREAYGYGKPSVHSTDTHRETVDLCGLVLTAGGQHLLANARRNDRRRLYGLLAQLAEFSRTREFGLDRYCVVGSAVFSMYGLRDCRDLDVLNEGVITHNDLPQGVGDHGSQLMFYPCGRQELFHDPTRYFRFLGVRFANLSTILEMKRNRNEEKDRQDLALSRRC